MKHHYRKHYSLEEARAMLPILRGLLQDLRRRRERVQQADTELSQMMQKTGDDLGGQLVNSLLLDLLQLQAQLQRLQELGIELKDVNRGLVDFPHLRDGREVFLCWKLDEDDIEFWHDIDAGYAGREPL